MIGPGNPANGLPPRPDDQARKVRDLQRQQQEQSAAISGVAIANVIIPQANSAFTNSYTLTTSYQTLASFNFTVPAGCTQVLINASGCVTCGTNQTGGDTAFVRVRINGSGGPEQRTIWNTTAIGPAVPAVAAAALTGLTAGSTITIDVQAHLAGGPGVSLAIVETAAVTASALFLP